MQVLAPTLSLMELQAFDPEGGRGPANGRRWRCPLPECSHRKTRDLSVDESSGAWNCKHCAAHGKLREHWENSGPGNGSGHSAHELGRRAHSAARQQRARLSQLEDPRATAAATAARAESETEWRRHLVGLRPLEDSPGAKYLHGRGIALDVARSAGGKFHPAFYGRPAVVFPVRDRDRATVAINARFLRVEGEQLKTQTVGPKSGGVFLAPSVCESGRVFDPLEAAAPAIIITEAPIDALSLASAGFPALALCGINRASTKLPHWLQLACGLRCVLLAFDADEAGDEAAPALIARLRPYGARCGHLRPEGAKDWNEMLQVLGREGLADWLAERVL